LLFFSIAFWSVLVPSLAVASPERTIKPHVRQAWSRVQKTAKLHPIEERQLAAMGDKVGVFGGVLSSHQEYKAKDGQTYRVFHKLRLEDGRPEAVTELMMGGKYGGYTLSQETKRVRTDGGYEIETLYSDHAKPSYLDGTGKVGQVVALKRIFDAKGKLVSQQAKAADTWERVARVSWEALPARLNGDRALEIAAAFPKARIEVKGIEWLDPEMSVHEALSIVDYGLRRENPDKWRQKRLEIIAAGVKEVVKTLKTLKTTEQEVRQALGKE
jgi:hypothetical protein